MAMVKKVVNGLGVLVALLLLCSSFLFAQARKCPDMEAIMCEGIAYDESLYCGTEIQTTLGKPAANDPDAVDFLCEGIPYSTHIKPPCRKFVLLKDTDNPSGEELIAEGF